MLFPDCKFEVLLPGGVVWAGTRVEATLVVEVPKAIPRAAHLDLRYAVTAWAGYGSGNGRHVARSSLFAVPLQVGIPDRLLPAGTHRYPFTLDVPAWLPQAYSGRDCGIEHELMTSLEVHWAVDPKVVLHPAVVMAPSVATRAPANIRSPAGFHDSIVLEITLASTVVAGDEDVVGEIALRSGHDARFSAVEVSLGHFTTLRLGRVEHRVRPVMAARCDGDTLRRGEVVRFVLPTRKNVTPTFRTQCMDHDVGLIVRVDVPWGRDPELTIPLQILPAGSTLHGDASLGAVGGARLRLGAEAMARETGFAVGRAPVLVEGSVGPVHVRIIDAPRDGALGIDAELSFPELELGTSFHPRGVLDGFRDSPLLPERLRDTYFLRCTPASPIDPSALAAFFAALTDRLETASELRISDRHLAVHFALGADDDMRLGALAMFLKGRAEVVATAIAALPFPTELAASRATWEAVAREELAFLVPTGPSMVGLRIGAQLLDGSARVLDVSLRTVREGGAPITRAAIDLGREEIPAEAIDDLEKGSANELVRTIRETFPAASVRDGVATLERPGFTADPRMLLGALDVVLAWVLGARGERRASAPYR